MICREEEQTDQPAATKITNINDLILKLLFSDHSDKLMEKLVRANKSDRLTRKLIGKVIV